jgi:pimeloyl-ACP methyl ester carboxylesterase/formiminotetrahydrofolate cyclodeaminase
VAYDIFGDGPPVVLVHGTPSWSYLWRGVARRLSERWTVHVYDLLGYGDSEKLEGQDVSIAAQTDLFVELLDHWGLRSPFVAGHDIGAAIALRAFLLRGVRYRRLALADAVAIAPWITPFSRHVKRYLEAYQTMPEHVYRQVLPTHLRSAIRKEMDDEALVPYLSPWSGESGQAAYYRQVAQFDERYTTEVEPLYGSIDLPVLILWGEQDGWLDLAFAGRLHSAIPGSQLRTIPGAGHFVPEDAPDAVAAALDDFFAAEPGRDNATLEPERASSSEIVSTDASTEDADVPDYPSLPLGRFLELAASREPTPGGGAVAAVTVALAAALSSMSARFSKDHLAEAPALAERAEQLRSEAMPLARADAAAYGRVLDACWAPHDGDKEERRWRIREALSEAASVPLSIAEIGSEVAGIASRLVEEGNPNLKGDAVAAVEFAAAGVRAAAKLVELNVSAGGADDGRLARASELAVEAATAQRAAESAGARGV